MITSMAAIKRKSIPRDFFLGEASNFGLKHGNGRLIYYRREPEAPNICWGFQNDKKEIYIIAPWRDIRRSI